MVEVGGGLMTRLWNLEEQQLREWKKLAMYIQRNTEARSFNHCNSGKAISITCSESVFVALRIQHAMLMRHIVICGPLGRTIFFHIIS